MKTDPSPSAGVTYSPQLAHAREYERWLGGHSLSGAAMRWWLGSPGTFLANTALFRLPEELHLTEDWRVVDVGCGRGSLLRMLDKRLNFIDPPVGIDASTHAIQLAATDNGARDTTRPPLHLVQGTGTALPLRTASAELVICGHLVKNLDDQELGALLHELGRVLVSGGLALIWDFAPTGNRWLDRWNTWFLSRGVGQPRLRSTSSLLHAARLAGFDFRIDAQLRPFLLPPIPRASILIGKQPDSPIN